MTRYSLIPYMVFVLYSATSFGWTDDDVYHYLSNNTALSFAYQQNVSITCYDTNEVEWKVDSTVQTTNFIKEISPNEKILRIEKITPHDTGIYKCVSKKNSNLFKKLIVTIWGDRLDAAGLPKYPLLSFPYTGRLSLKT
ncbi:uncharacterized protein LOC135839057 [Planococcus citri]|uniref:uncharacterized protein LOC135839057 n=1 Tax=Planococcus citri TaxID=170843 RepID=UPI0031FA43E1